jgi:Ser/Thr protein kinase RdoA (MazF antagonist)
MRHNAVVQPLRHGYTNDTRTDGVVVLKRYAGPGDARARRSTEAAALSALAGVLPVPPLLHRPAGALLMEHLDGRHGQELIDEGHAAAVLRACGAMLRRVQGADVTAVFSGIDVPAGSQVVLVHGDYGPNNLLLDPQTFAVTAILDWEWCHPGGRVEDLAWCEWIVRMHHPGATGALDELFAAYGRRPPWPERRAAALAKCHTMLALARSGADAAAGERHWRRNIEITRSWRE